MLIYLRESKSDCGQVIVSGKRKWHCVDCFLKYARPYDNNFGLDYELGNKYVVSTKLYKKKFPGKAISRFDYSNWPAKSYELMSFDFVFENQHSSSYHLKCSKNWSKINSKRKKWTLKLQLHWNHGFFVNKRLLAKNIRLSSCQIRFYLDFDSRRGLVGSVLAYSTKSQGSRPRPDIKTKYDKYFFGHFLLADFWQKLWESK